MSMNKAAVLSEIDRLLDKPWVEKVTIKPVDDGAYYVVEVQDIDHKSYIALGW